MFAPPPNIRRQRNHVSNVGAGRGVSRRLVSQRVKTNTGEAGRRAVLSVPPPRLNDKKKAALSPPKVVGEPPLVRSVLDWCEARAAITTSSPPAAPRACCPVAPSPQHPESYPSQFPAPSPHRIGEMSSRHASANPEAPTLTHERERDLVDPPPPPPGLGRGRGRWATPVEYCDLPTVRSSPGSASRMGSAPRFSVPEFRQESPMKVGREVSMPYSPPGAPVWQTQPAVVHYVETGSVAESRLSCSDITPGSDVARSMPVANPRPPRHSPGRATVSPPNVSSIRGSPSAGLRSPVQDRGQVLAAAFERADLRRRGEVTLTDLLATFRTGGAEIAEYCSVDAGEVADCELLLLRCLDPRAEPRALRWGELLRLAEEHSGEPAAVPQPTLPVPSPRAPPPQPSPPPLAPAGLAGGKSAREIEADIMNGDMEELSDTPTDEGWEGDQDTEPTAQRPKTHTVRPHESTRRTHSSPVAADGAGGSGSDPSEPTPSPSRSGGGLAVLRELLGPGASEAEMLHAAVSLGRPQLVAEVARSVLPGALEAPGMGARTPCVAAVVAAVAAPHREETVEVVRELLNAGCRPDGEADDEGAAAVHHAASAARADLLQLLLGGIGQPRREAEANRTDGAGLSPLSRLQSGHAKTDQTKLCSRLLLRWGADVVSSSPPPDAAVPPTPEPRPAHTAAAPTPAVPLAMPPVATPPAPVEAHAPSYTPEAHTVSQTPEPLSVLSLPRAELLATPTPEPRAPDAAPTPAVTRDELHSAPRQLQHTPADPRAVPTEPLRDIGGEVQPPQHIPGGEWRG
eukprot:Hpha_TRINITY_DN15918_c1_g9::TRINITY_DN15918_c1_g9_i1::g.72171::m.72171